MRVRGGCLAALSNCVKIERICGSPSSAVLDAERKRSAPPFPDSASDLDDDILNGKKTQLLRSWLSFDVS